MTVLELVLVAIGIVIAMLVSHKVLGEWRTRAAQWIIWTVGKGWRKIDMAFFHCAGADAVRLAMEESQRGLPPGVHIDFIPSPVPPVEIPSEWKGAYPVAALDWMYENYGRAGFTDTDAPPFRCFVYTAAAGQLQEKPRLEKILRKKNEKALARYQKKNPPPEDLVDPQEEEIPGEEEQDDDPPEDGGRRLGKRFKVKVRIEISGVGETRYTLWGPFWSPMAGEDGRMWLCDAPDLPVVMAGEDHLDRFFSEAVETHRESDPFYVRIVTTGHAVWIDVQVREAGEAWVATLDGHPRVADKSAKDLVRGLWKKYADGLEPIDYFWKEEGGDA